MPRRAGLLAAVLLLAFVANSASFLTSRTAAKQGRTRRASTAYDEDEELLELAKVEERLMMGTKEPLLSENWDKKGKRAGGGLGFGAKRGSGSGGGTGGGGIVERQRGREQAKVLKREGVVRVDGVLTPEIAEDLRAFVLNVREEAFAALERGDEGAEGGFAQCLMASQRCDLQLPLDAPEVAAALRCLLCGAGGKVSNLMAAHFGEQSTLFELAALISEPGAPRQTLHPDTPLQDDAPLATAFIALQDVSEDMGPTTFIPGSHLEELHDRFDDDDERDEMLRTSKCSVALLNAGDASVFDSRILHCGGENRAATGSTRVLFYVTFRNPEAEWVGNVGSIRPGYVGKLTLQQMRERLDAGDDNPFAHLGSGLEA